MTTNARVLAARFGKLRMFAAQVCAVMLFAFFTGLATSPAAAAELPSALGARIGVHSEKTRFVLDLSRKVEFSTFTLESPYRVVMDFPEIYWRFAAPTAPAGSIVRGMRFGLFKPGRSRLVLELNGPAKVVKVFTIEARNGKGPRLVVDLAPIGADDYAAKAGWPEGTKTAALSPAPRPKPAHHGGKAKPIIALDPGHGGVDPGASAGGVREKDLVLNYAEHLRRKIEATGRYRVHMTRDRDVFLSLRERVANARNAGADLFISLHADIAEEGNPSGVAIYTLSQSASDAEAGALAELENRSDIIAGVNLKGENDDVTRILIDLAQRETMTESRRLAKLMIKEIGARAPVLTTKPVRAAGFRVLKAPDTPSVLIELGFLSNPKDRKRMQTSAWRAKSIRGVIAAIDEWMRTATVGVIAAK